MKPSSPEANLHHTQSHVYRTEQEFLDDVLGRGIGDIDCPPELATTDEEYHENKWFN